MVLDMVHLKAECSLAHFRELDSLVYCIAFRKIKCFRQRGLKCVLRWTSAPLLAEIYVQSQSIGEERWPSHSEPPTIQSYWTLKALSMLNTLLLKSGRAYFNSIRDDFSIYLISAAKEHFILPKINHSSSDWPLSGAVILKRSWPVKPDLFQMSTGPQRCPDAVSVMKEVRKKEREIYHKRWNLVVQHKLNLSSAHYPALS